IVSQLVKVDAATTVMQDVEFAPTLDGVQELQVVLLAKLPILVGSEHPFTGPAIGGIEDTARPLFQAGDGIGGESFGDDAQGSMHGTAVFTQGLQDRFSFVASKVFSDTKRAEDSLHKVGIVANGMIDELLGT